MNKNQFNNSFIVNSKIEMIERVEQTEKLRKQWKMWFYTIEDSYKDFIKYTKSWVIQ
jgi:hypothetical protein